MKKNNNKGFTLVELIVVLVILAILAAILVPALLGWIDKAREKQVTTNAEAAYIAAQALATEYYGITAPADLTKANAEAYVTAPKIKFLTDIDEPFTISVTCGDSGKAVGKVVSFTYGNAGYEAKWANQAHDGVGKGEWSVTKRATATTIADVTEDSNTKTSAVD